jgi:O-antigen/teichoic acid export membrane protein
MLLRGSIITLLYRLTGTTFWMLTSVITARALNVADLGIYVSTIVLVQAIGTVAASFASATGYFVSKGGRPEGEVASNGLLLSLMTGGALCLAGVLAAWLYHGDGRGILLLAGIALLPIIARNGLGGVALGTNALWRYNFSVHGPAYMNVALLAGWVLLFENRTVEGALTAWVAAQYLSLVGLMVLGRGWWTWLVAHRPDWRLMGAIVSFGAVIGLAGFISYFNYRVDQLLVVWLDGEAGAGAYSRAVTLAEALWLVSTSIAIASYASVGTLSRREAAALTTAGVRHTLIVVIPGAAVTFVVAPYVLELLYGGQYTNATDSLRVLCVGTALFAPQSILANYFTVQMGRPWISMSIAATSCLINIALSLVLIPRVGFVGGAWATTVSYASVGALSVALFLRNSDARLSDLWRIRGQDLAAYLRLLRLPRGALSGMAGSPGKQA